MLCFAKMDSLNYILLTINSFHKNIKFTMETEQNSTIAFLDVLLIRTSQKIHTTTVYCKKTNTNLYMKWNSTIRNRGHSKLWYVEHTRPTQLIHIYEMY